MKQADWLGNAVAIERIQAAKLTRHSQHSAATGNAVQECQFASQGIRATKMGIFVDVIGSQRGAFKNRAQREILKQAAFW